MQRIIFLILIITSIINARSASSKLENNYEVNNSDEISYSQMKEETEQEEDAVDVENEVSIRIIDESITSKGLEYEIINNTSYPYYINYSYTISRYVEGSADELYKAPPRGNDEADPIDKNGKEIVKVDWSKTLGELEQGEYILKIKKQTSYSPREYEEIELMFSIE